MSQATAIAFFTCAFLASSVASAAQLYGRILRGGRPLSGTEVVVTCKDVRQDETTTDERGGYRLYAAATGTCQISIPTIPGASADINSYESPTRFDFELVDDRLMRR